MAWFRNRYVCPECNANWTDEWSSMSDDRCGDCDIKGISPVGSDDLSVAIEQLADGGYAVLVSSKDASESADYVEAFRFDVLQWPRASGNTPKIRVLNS